MGKKNALTQEELKNIFMDQVRKDLDFMNSRFAVHDKQNAYYDDEYRDKLISLQKEDKVYDVFKGLEYRKYDKKTKICSIVSSSRLFYFLKRKYIPNGFIFEETGYHFIGDEGDDNKAHFDGHHNNIFYEAKCQEIVSTSHSQLKADFYDEIIRREFDISSEFQKKTHHKTDTKKNITIEYETIIPTQKQFNICKKDDTSIYSLHFDVKQLITHLLALGNRKDQSECVSLKYVVFSPTDNEDGDLKSNLYDPLMKEFDSIRSEGSLFSAYMKENKIRLADIMFVDIKGVRDLIAEDK